MRADRRLCVDRSMARLVDEDAPEAAFQLAAKGGEIPDQDVKRLGLIQVNGVVAQASQAPWSAPVIAKALEEAVAPAIEAVAPKAERLPIMPPQAKRGK